MFGHISTLFRVDTNTIIAIYQIYSGDDCFYYKVNLNKCTLNKIDFKDYKKDYEKDYDKYFLCECYSTGWVKNI